MSEAASSRSPLLIARITAEMFHEELLDEVDVGFTGSAPILPSHPETRLTLPFAALVALVAAILETSVLAELPLAGATVDLVLVCAAVATLVLGIEDGLIIAFVGGLLVDMLIPDRPMGAATLAMLLALGLAFVVSRVLGSGRRVVAVGLVLILTPVFHLLFTGIMVLFENADLAFNFSAILVAAVLNSIVAIAIAALFGVIERRFGATEREW